MTYICHFNLLCLAMQNLVSQNQDYQSKQLYHLWIYINTRKQRSLLKKKNETSPFASYTYFFLNQFNTICSCLDVAQRIKYLSNVPCAIPDERKLSRKITDYYIETQSRQHWKQKIRILITKLKIWIKQLKNLKFINIVNSNLFKIQK